MTPAIDPAEGSTMNLPSPTLRVLGAATVSLFLVGAVAGTNRIAGPPPSRTVSHFNPTMVQSAASTPVPARPADPDHHVDGVAHETADPSHNPDVEDAVEIDHPAEPSHQPARHHVDESQASDHVHVPAGEAHESGEMHEGGEHDGEPHD